jgi:hypothetical protein
MMGKKTTWGDVKKGDSVELRGHEYRVVKSKRKGKKVRVMVERRGGYVEATLAATERVKIVKPPKLIDKTTGAQTRWATEAERKAALGKGDPKRTKPPAPAAGDPWETPAGRIERKLDEILSARLVGETKDESAGYYVPPVDVSTVASHLAIFHGGIPSAAENEIAMLEVHDAQHAEAAKRGLALAVNHWHTERRP